MRCLRRRWEGQQGSRGQHRRVGGELERPCWVVAAILLHLRSDAPTPCLAATALQTFDLQYCDNALQYARSEHIIVISAMSSI